MLVVFLTICGTRLGIDVSGGEEHYLTFAKQFTNPEWIPGSFTLTEYPGTRLIFQWIVGPLVEIMGFEPFVFWSRLVNFLLLSIPLALIFRKLRLGILETFVLVQLFVMSEQNLLGGEWIIKSFEPKSLAYAFVFFGIYFMLQSRYLLVGIALAVATYFHVLVGAWCMLAIGMLLLFEWNWKAILQASLPYMVCCAPFALYLADGYFSPAVSADEINTDWVYCYYRLAKHLGIFYFWEFFKSTHLVGVILTLGAFSLVLVLKRFAENKMLERLLIIAAIGFCINLVFVMVAYLDHAMLDNSGGLGLKYYPFRLNSIASLFLLISIYLWVRTKFGQRWKARLGWTVLVLVGVLSAGQVVNNVKRSLKTDTDFDQMCVYIHNNTAQEAKFGLIGQSNKNRTYWGFIRKAERENFSVTKFIPADKQKIPEWYRRNVEHIAMNKKPELAGSVAFKFGLDYILSDQKLNEDDLTMIHKQGAYQLYKCGPDR